VRAGHRTNHDLVYRRLIKEGEALNTPR
jgi:hypothetical protein